MTLQHYRSSEKRAKKIHFFAAISVFLLVFILISCDSTADTDTQTSVAINGDSGTAEAAAEEMLKITDGGKTDYTLIRADDPNEFEISAYKRFSSLLKKYTGVSPELSTDFEKAGTKYVRQPHEIIIGRTNREDEYVVDEDFLSRDAYMIFTSGERLVIIAAGEAGYEKAFSALFSEILGIDDISADYDGEHLDFAVPQNYSLLGGSEMNTLSITLDSGKGSLLSGNISHSDAGYYTTSSLIYTFASDILRDFNRYTIKYSSDTPVRGTVKYSCGNKITEEEFYLPKGEKAEFSSLLELFGDGKNATHLEEIDFAPISGSGNIELFDIKTESIKQQDEKIIYMENARFRVGIYLSWGGGICYFEDKQDGDDSVSNLLNMHDTGRLVQQSYYGTGSAPYERATYNSTLWSYNPVQGGDQYGNKSRLVDYSISEDGLSVYIKCQPLDWAKNNEPTPSYMENTYTLYDNYLAVDNSFTDYSGYTHPSSHQEVPAFYTISYLSEFTYYAGTNGWTGDTLTTLKDLPFWAGNASAYHPCLSDEKWFAWTAANGFGIGIYVPIAQQIVAGRFSYDGSKSDHAASTNYVAPLITKKMVSFETFSYSYAITSGTLEEIRSVFAQIKK